MSSGVYEGVCCFSFLEPNPTQPNPLTPKPAQGGSVGGCLCVCAFFWFLMGSFPCTHPGTHPSSRHFLLFCIACLQFCGTHWGIDK
jgi:hypothetical protein